MKQLPAPEIVVVSPHLDDAVFSAHAVLEQGHSRWIELVTVVTEPGSGWDSGWGAVTGFSSGEEEFLVRRKEDDAAAAMLGVSNRHLGGESDRVGAAAGLLEDYFTSLLAVNPDPVVLVPAGAGRVRGRYSPRNIMNSVLRRPIGPGAHPDHEIVRDVMVAICNRMGMRKVGFYLENPYLWSDSITRLDADLQRRLGRRLFPARVHVDGGAKLLACEAYVSQATLILGEKRSYRRKVLSFPEQYLVTPELQAAFWCPRPD